MKSIPEATPIILTKEERAELEGLARSTKTEHRLRQRARIVLVGGGWLANARDRPRGGLYNGHGLEVAGALRRKAAWRGSMRPATGATIPNTRRPTTKRILAAARSAPFAAGLCALDGTADRLRAWRCRCAIYLALLRAQKIDLAARKSWCESNDPDFAAKAAEIVGLYLNPPRQRASCSAVDEKPSIQALERKQGYLKLPTGAP